MSITKPDKHRRFVGANDRADRLPEGALACRSCGIAVTVFAATPVEHLVVYGQRNALGLGSDMVIQVTRCGRCATRREHAAAILRRHPIVANEHGNVGLDRLDAALAVLDILGRTSRMADTLTATDADVRALIDTFAALGGWASWSRPSNAAPGACTSKRWGYLSGAIGQDMKAAFAGLIRRRLELAKPLAPPSSHGAIRGCGLCGIGTVLAKESNIYAAWGDELRMPLASLGGQGGEVTAHVCAVCRPSLISTGAVGLPATWNAVIRSRGFEPRGDSVVSLTGVVPWAALGRGAEANSVPWQHVNIEALDRELMSTTVVRRIETDGPAALIVGWVK
jgi:hypothetical protein